VVGAALLLSWGVIAALATLGLMIPYLQAGIAPTGAIIASTNETIPKPAAVHLFEASVVAGHSASTDCWIILDGRVYDLTPYIVRHPEAEIIPFCGMDASTALGLANLALTEYYVGDFALPTPAEPPAPVKAPVIKKARGTPPPSFFAPAAVPVEAPVAIDSPQPPSILSAEVVSQHNAPDDCWIIFSGSIYDVTNFISLHPGGAEALTPYCGADGTAALAEIPHSADAFSLLRSLVIGPLDSVVEPGQTFAHPAVDSALLPTS
jgi:cytochrome b involved in lipid metabolism